MTGPVDFRYPGTAATLKELQQVESDAADTAPDVDPGEWERKYLQKLPPNLKCSIDAIDGKISRDQLWKLADLSREDPEDRAALSTFFWNVLAWGISGDWRRVSAIQRAIVSRPAEVMHELREAQTASFEGRIADAFKITHGLIPYWGPAFATKFLAFSADRGSARPQAITFDSRVQLAWSILINSLGSQELTPRRYELICTKAAHLAKRYQWEPSDLEACLFLFGQKVGSHERWLDLVLAELGESFPAAAVFSRLLERGRA